MTKEFYHYNLNLTVQNGLGVIARLAILLRKFNVNIQSFEAKPLDDEKKFYSIRLVVDSVKDHEAFQVVTKKLERLVPVVKVNLDYL